VGSNLETKKIPPISDLKEEELSDSSECPHTKHLTDEQADKEKWEKGGEYDDDLGRNQSRYAAGQQPWSIKSKAWNFKFTLELREVRRTLMEMKTRMYVNPRPMNR